MKTAHLQLSVSKYLTPYTLSSVGLCMSSGLLQGGTSLMMAESDIDLLV